MTNEFSYGFEEEEEEEEAEEISLSSWRGPSPSLRPPSWSSSGKRPNEGQMGAGGDGGKEAEMRCFLLARSASLVGHPPTGYLDSHFSKSP